LGKPLVWGSFHFSFQGQGGAKKQFVRAWNIVSEVHKGSAEKSIFQVAKNCFFATATQAQPQPLAESAERE
jgi:hypothetical protein